VSDIDINEAIKEVAKNIENDENKNEEDNEDPNDINRIFMEQISKLKNSKEVKEFYYKEKLNIFKRRERNKRTRKNIL